MPSPKLTMTAQPLLHVHYIYMYVCDCTCVFRCCVKHTCWSFQNLAFDQDTHPLFTYCKLLMQQCFHVLWKPHLHAVSVCTCTCCTCVWQRTHKLVSPYKSCANFFFFFFPKWIKSLQTADHIWWPSNKTMRNWPEICFYLTLLRFTCYEFTVVE